MTKPAFVDKAEIVATLMARGQTARADWVGRQLPDVVDTYTNASILRTLNIDLATMTAVQSVPEPSAT